MVTQRKPVPWDEDTVGHYLLVHRYKTIEEWALDSDLTYDKGSDTWLNEEKQPIELESYLLSTLESQVE